MEKLALLSLYDLLKSRTTVGQLATMIEKHGVRGWDCFDRFGYFDPNSQGANQALEALQELNRAKRVREDHLEESGEDPGHPWDVLDNLDTSTSSCDLHLFGWYEKEMPEIPAETSPPPPTAKSRQRPINSPTYILGTVMLRLDELRTRMAAVPSQAALTTQIVSTYKDIPGISRSNIEKYVGEAKKAVLAVHDPGAKKHPN